MRQEAGVDGAHPDARVVDEQVDAPEALPHLRHPGGDGTLVAGVERQAEGARAQVGGGVLGALRVAARDRDARARVDERPASPRPLVAPVTSARVPPSSVMRSAGYSSMRPPSFARPTPRCTFRRMGDWPKHLAVGLAALQVAGDRQRSCARI